MMPRHAWSSPLLYFAGRRRPRREGRRVRPARLPSLESLERRRLLSAGDPDGGFHAEQVAPATLSGFVAESVAVQDDGKIVVAGYPGLDNSSATAEDFALARFNPDGTLDTTFGDPGADPTKRAGATRTNFIAGSDTPLPDGGQILPGSSDIPAHV